MLYAKYSTAGGIEKIIKLAKKSKAVIYMQYILRTAEKTMVKAIYLKLIYKAAASLI